MAKKLITAADVLKMKGYNMAALNGTEILGIIGEYYLTHELSDVIHINAIRFVEYKGAPKCGYIDLTTYDAVGKLFDEHPELFGVGNIVDDTIYNFITNGEDLFLDDLSDEITSEIDFHNIGDGLEYRYCKEILEEYFEDIYKKTSNYKEVFDELFLNKEWEGHYDCDKIFNALLVRFDNGFFNERYNNFIEEGLQYFKSTIIIDEASEDADVKFIKSIGGYKIEKIRGQHKYLLKIV